MRIGGCPLLGRQSPVSSEKKNNGVPMSSIISSNVRDTASSVANPSLMGGVAEVDITPPVGLPMWGYAARSGPSRGTLDPLFARVLVLEVGEQRLALVTLDLGRPFGPASLEYLRGAVRKSSHISNVLVVASHTHSGPIVQDEYPGGDTPHWETEALEKIAKAIDEAHRHCLPVRIGTGYGTVSIGHNRRRVNQDGTITWLDRNTTRIPTAPVDPVVSVVRVDTREGLPLAILMNYACHPVTFGPDNLEYSADFPGVATQTVREAFASKPVCFFLQGAPGDINPFHAATPLEQDAVKMRDWEGEQLGREAVRVARAIQPQEEAQPSLQFAEEIVPFGLRWTAEEWRRLTLSAYGQTFTDSFLPRIRPEWQLPIVTFLINRHIAFMGMPGEPYVEFQINWRDRCPVRDAFFLGYAGGYYGYFPTLQGATEGGYGATSPTTWIEVGAGERMVNHALVRIYEMLGRLRKVPDVTSW